MTRRGDIYAEIVEFLRTRYGVDPGLITEETRFLDEFGLDSLDLLAMAQILQGKYRICMDDERIASVRTIGDVLDFVENKARDRA